MQPPFKTMFANRYYVFPNTIPLKICRFCKVYRIFCTGHEGMWTWSHTGYPVDFGDQFWMQGAFLSFNCNVEGNNIFLHLDI